MNIRPYSESDWPKLWQIIEPVFRDGSTYPYDPNLDEEAAQRIWIAAPSATFIAEGENAAILGSYYIKPNQPTLGAHVCNCGFLVSRDARGKGIASLMCEHSQDEAIASGYRAMQFNLVVSTNEGAIRLWKKLGFHIVGTLPKAFRRANDDYVDAHVMFKQLIV